MTTVLHRSPKIDHLKKDYAIKNKAKKGIDDVDEKTKQHTIDISRKIVQIIYDHHPVNMGQGRLGSLAQGRSIEDILDGLKNIGGLSASIFDNRGAVLETVKTIKEGEFGQSITLAGAIDDIFEICREVGTVPHTAIVPLGIWGRTELLPREGVMEMTMMCGHGLLGGGHVETVLKRVKNNEITIDEAASVLSKVCVCGAFNNSLAKELIAEALNKEE